MELWQFLFLIPSVTILFLPILLKTLPSKSGNGQKVDAFGFVIFGFATAFLTLFFSYMAWWMLVVSLLLFVAFAFYINKASNPFITPAFFKNTRWLRAICLILVFYFVNYALSPIFNAIGTNIYGMTTTQVSLHIVWAFVVAAVVGTCSGMIIRKIGIKAGIVTAGTLMFLGWTGAAFCVNSGFVVLTLCACVFYAGCGLMYSPVVSTVLGTIEKDESGRGFGMNDLAMNVSPSIGIAIIGMVLAWDPNSSVFRVVSFAWAGFGAAFGPVMLFSLFWKRANKQGALAGMITGGAVVFIWKYLIAPMGGAWAIYELLPAFLAACIAIVIVSLATPAPEKAVTDTFDEICGK